MSRCIHEVIVANGGSSDVSPPGECIISCFSWRHCIVRHLTQNRGSCGQSGGCGVKRRSGDVDQTQAEGIRPFLISAFRRRLKIPVGKCLLWMNTCLCTSWLDGEMFEKIKRERPWEAGLFSLRFWGFLSLGWDAYFLFETYCLWCLLPVWMLAAWWPFSAAKSGHLNSQLDWNANWLFLFRLSNGVVWLSKLE